MPKETSQLLLRLQAGLKEALTREAVANGRTVTAEINQRLKASLEPGHVPAAQTQSGAAPAREPAPPAYLSATDQAILDVIRRLPPEKQLALLSLFK